MTRVLPNLLTQVPQTLMRLRIVREQSGDTLVELALCVSLLLVPLVVATMELGVMVYDSIEVSNAAHAGAMYGMMGSTYAASTSAITSAAQAEAMDFGANLAVAPSVYYACSSAIGGTQYSTQSAATSACTGSGNHALEFVQVGTSVTITPPIKCPWLPNSYTLRGFSVMEVEE
jgi:Flp pilus assembly protein TadG